jgi:hypothetical protein
LLIQCRRGPTSPSGIAFSEDPSDAPNERNTSSTVSSGMLPTSRTSCATGTPICIVKFTFIIESGKVRVKDGPRVPPLSR